MRNTLIRAKCRKQLFPLFWKNALARWILTLIVDTWYFSRGILCQLWKGRRVHIYSLHRSTFGNVATVQHFLQLIKFQSFLFHLASLARFPLHTFSNIFDPWYCICMYVYLVWSCYEIYSESILSLFWAYSEPILSLSTYIYSIFIPVLACSGPCSVPA